MSDKKDREELFKKLETLPMRDLFLTDQIEKQVLLFSAGVISLSITGLIALREYETVEVLSEYSALFTSGLYSIITASAIALIRLVFSSNVRNRLDNWEDKDKGKLYKAIYSGPIKVFIPFFVGICLISLFFLVNIFDYDWPPFIETSVYLLSQLLLPLYGLLLVILELRSKFL
jgi:hypothetical protein